MTTPVQRILYGAPGPDGRTPFWRMATIWAAAEGRPRGTVAIADLGVLDAVVWFGGRKDVQPTVRRVAERARDILAADLPGCGGMRTNVHAKGEGVPWPDLASPAPLLPNAAPAAQCPGGRAPTR